MTLGTSVTWYGKREKKGREKGWDAEHQGITTRRRGRGPREGGRASRGFFCCFTLSLSLSRVNLSVFVSRMPFQRKHTKTRDIWWARPGRGSAWARTREGYQRGKGVGANQGRVTFRFFFGYFPPCFDLPKQKKEGDQRGRGAAGSEGKVQGKVARV